MSDSVGTRVLGPNGSQAAAGPALRGHDRSLRCQRDAHRAVQIGAQHRHARQRPQHGRVGVAVVVALTDRHHRRAGADGVEEGRVVRVAAVVGDLQDRRGEQVGTGEQAPLRGLFGVAGQQQRAVLAGDPQHHGVVVGLVAQRAVGDRAQHHDVRGAEREAPAGGHRHDRDAAAAGSRDGGGGGLGGVG